MKCEIKETSNTQFINTPRGCLIWNHSGGSVYMADVNLDANNEWVPAPGFGAGQQAPIRIAQDANGVWTTWNDLTGIKGEADNPIQSLGNSMLQHVRFVDADESYFEVECATGGCKAV